MSVVWKIVYCVVIAVICYLAARISKKITDKIFATEKGILLNGSAKKKTLKSITNNVIKVAIYFVGILSILNYLGVPMTSLVAVSGSAAVAIGLGAQNLVSDILAGVFILVEEQFNVGDIVTINGCTGEVEKVTMRTTRLRNPDGTVYIIPNGTISVVTNKCKEFINAIVDVGIAYEEDIDKVIEILNDEMDKAEGNINGLLARPDVLGIIDLSDSAVVLRVVAKCAVKENLGVEREIRLRIKRRLVAENVSIPYPQRTIHVVNN